MADNENGEKGSLLRTALAATPAAAGLGYAAKNALSGVQGATAPARSPQSEIIRAATRTNPPIPTHQDHLAFMRSGLDPSIARTAWRQALTPVDPLTRQSLLAFSGDVQALPLEQVIPTITHVMERNQSQLAGSIFSRFTRSVRGLQAQANLTGLAPEFLPIDPSSVLVGNASNQLPTNLALRLGSLKNRMGGTVHSRAVSRAEWAGSRVFEFTFRGHKVGDFKVNMPLEVGGIIQEGGSLQTRRISPSVGIFDPATHQLERISRSEFFLRQIEESIAPDIGSRFKKQGDVQRAIDELYRATFHQLETVPNVPAGILSETQATYESRRASAIDIVVRQHRRARDLSAGGFVSAFRDPTEEEIGSVLTTHTDIYGGVDPGGMGKGRLSTFDWSTLSMAPPDYGRRPEQGTRLWSLTQRASENMNRHSRYARYRAYETVGQRTSEQMLGKPNVRVMYIDPSMHQGALEAMGMGKGEAVMARETAGMLEFGTTKAQALTRLRAGLTPGDLATTKFSPGEAIGETETGSLFKYSPGMEILAAPQHTSESRGAFVNVLYREKRAFEHGGKVFEDVKALVLHRDSSKMLEEAARIAPAIIPGPDPIDMFVSMDDLRKNQSLHHKQIMTELSEILGNRPALPGASGGMYNHEEFISRAMRHAIQNNVNAPQFGRVFGSVPYVMGAGAAERLVEQAAPGMAGEYLSYMRQGVSFGIAKLAYGGPEELTGVGAMGSLESRAFDILRAQGGVGPGLANEFAERMRLTLPERLATHEQIGRTLSSIAGGFTPDKGAALYDITAPGGGYKSSTFQSFIEKGGGMLRVGGGFEDIYVPGSDIKALSPFETAAGDTVRSHLSDIYHDIASTASRMYSQTSPLHPNEFSEHLLGYTDLLRKEWAPFGGGLGGYLGKGSRLFGSRFLRGVSEGAAGGTINNPFVAGISPEMFEEMMGEMGESGIYSRQELHLIHQRFMSGQDVGGALARHPLIGPFSIQPTMFRKVEGAGEQIILPEIYQDIAGSIHGGEKFQKTIQLGPLVGMAGDKDADIFSAILVSPDSEKAVRKSIMSSDNAFTEAYIGHQVRMQLFKAGSAAEEGAVSIRQAMISNVQKLGTGQKWIAPLSVELTSARRALATHGQGRAAADALFLLEWLEQTPISAKHLGQDAGGGKLESLMVTITESLRQRNALNLQGTISGIVANDAVAKSLLTGNIHLDRGAEQISQIYGTRVQNRLQGVNMEASVKEMMRSLSQFDRSGEGRISELLGGRGVLGAIEEIPEIIARASARATTSSAGVFSSVSKAALSMRNKLGALGEGMIKHHKAIGFGFAGSLALSAILSSPSETIGPGSGIIPQGRMEMSPGKAASRVEPETVMPSQQNMGTPTAPNLMRNQTVRMGGRHIQVNSRAPVGVNAAAMGGALPARAGINGRTNVHLSDNRSSINPHLLGNKIL